MTDLPEPTQFAEVLRRRQLDDERRRARVPEPLRRFDEYADRQRSSAGLQERADVGHSHMKRRD